MGITIYSFNIPTNYLFSSVIFYIIWNTQIEVSTNLSIDVKPNQLSAHNLNHFTVISEQHTEVQRYGQATV